MKMIVYVIVQSKNDCHPDHILPCIATLTVDGKRVKSFSKLYGTHNEELEPYLSKDISYLNDICFEMWEEIKEHDVYWSGGYSKYKRSLSDFYDLWNKAMPILKQQRFVFKYIVHYRIKLYCIFKSQFFRVLILDGKPTLKFYLIDNGAYYRFALKVYNREDVLSRGSNVFCYKSEDRLFFLQSANDAELNQWMNRFRWPITIFKEHFPEFEDKYLSLLQERYEIITINSEDKELASVF